MKNLDSDDDDDDSYVASHDESSNDSKQLGSEDLSGEVKDEAASVIKEENNSEDKSRADSLWRSFLSDVANPPKQKVGSSSSTKDELKTTSGTDEEMNGNSSSMPSAVEENKIRTPVSSSTVENSSVRPLTTSAKKKSAPLSQILKRDNLKKRPISSILNNINKKTKLSTLEKSKLDWNQYKEEYSLKEELSTFNRGKNGYLERQDFLQRTDSRQFLVEKELRKGKNHRS